jgi:hypothetical protein
MTAIAITSVTCSAALAGNSTSQPQTGALPGVTNDYRIAQPAPQPEPDDALPTGENGTFTIGNTDVRISGSITVDMATGGIKQPRR